MRSFIFIALLLCAPVKVFGFENCFPVGKEGAKTTYASCDVCEEKEDAECFSVSEKPLDEYSIKEVQVDDYEKPTYKKAYNVMSCSGKSRKECAEMAEHPEFCIEGDQGLYREVDSGFEAYCTKHLGYEKKIVKQLLPDDSKKAQKLAKKEEQEALRSSIKSEIAECAEAKGTMTTAKLTSCVQAILKERSLN